MFHAQSSLLDFPPLPLPHGAPSLLFPSHGSTHCDPHLGGQSGRLPERSPLTPSAREGLFTEHQEVRDYFKLRTDQAAEGEEEQPYPDSLERNVIQDCFLKSRGVT